MTLTAKPRSGHLIRHRRLFRAASCEVGGLRYSLDAIEHGLLRGNASPLRPAEHAAPRRPAPRRRPLGPRPARPLRAQLRRAVLSPGSRVLVNRAERELADAQSAYLAAETTIDRDGRRLELPGLLKLYRADFGSEAELVSAAAGAIGGGDGGWISANSARLEVAFGRVDWRMVPRNG